MLIRSILSILMVLCSASLAQAGPRDFEFFGLELLLVDYIPRTFIMDVTIGLVGTVIFVILTMFLKPRKIAIDEITSENSPMKAVICQRIALFAFIYCMFFFFWGVLERQGYL